MCRSIWWALIALAFRRSAGSHELVYPNTSLALASGYQIRGDPFRRNDAVPRSGAFARAR